MRGQVRASGCLKLRGRVPPRLLLTAVPSSDTCPAAPYLSSLRRRFLFCARSTRHRCLESGLLGGLADPAGHDIYLNVAEPFCLITLGVQVGRRHLITAVDCAQQCPVHRGAVPSV